VIGTLLALGRWEEFSLHVRSAIEQRALTVDEVKEVVLQQAVYCGVPAANHALSVVRSVVSTASATSLLGPARSRSRSSGTRRDRGRSRT
jgi:alkylhydroperoxidase/carboxymuconolactone decarboxylase family protein YurZ